MKTVKIGSDTFNLAPTGAVLVIYKQQFGVDYYDDFLKIKDINENIGASEIEKVELTYRTGYRLVWAMAKAADSSVPDPDSWLDRFDNFPITELLPVAMELLGESFEQVISDGGGKGEKLTSENLVACCLACGLNMQDIREMSIGFLLNSINEFIKIKSGGKSGGGGTRKATQADFDAF